MTAIPIEEYIAAMQQAFRPAQARGLNVTYLLNLGGDDGAWTFAINNQQCRISPGAAEKADTVISMSVGAYHKLAAGRLNVQNAYRRGEVRVSGNLQHALKFADLFEPWESLAQADSEADSDSDDTQPLSTKPVVAKPPPVAQPALTDYVQAMPGGLRADQAAGKNITYRFQIGDDVWTVQVADGQATALEGGHGSPTVTIAMSADDFIKLAEGRLNTVQAYQARQISVKGHLNAAAQIPTLFAPWAAAVQPATATPPDSPPPTKPRQTSSPSSSLNTRPLPPPPPPPASLSSTPVTPPAQPKTPRPSTPASESESEMDRYFRAMVKNFRPDKAGNLDATYQLKIDDGNSGVYTIDIKDKRCAVYRGAIDPSPTVEIIMSRDSYQSLAQGQFNPKRAFQTGQLKVLGKTDLAIEFVQVFKPWQGDVNATNLPDFDSPPPPFQLPSPRSTSAGLAYPTLVNGSFDYYQPLMRDGKPKFWREFPERYGAGWQLTVISEGKDNGTHLMDSGVFGKFAQRYFNGNGHDYHIHGKHSQVITSRYAFDLVLYQTVAAEPGRTYEFSGAAVTFFRGPGTPPAHNKIFKQLGIDPGGGADYAAGSVVWGDRDGKDNEWRYPKLTVKAQADALTLFIRITNTEADVGRTDLNTVHLENFKLS